jgi:hypothetical protein
MNPVATLDLPRNPELAFDGDGVLFATWFFHYPVFDVFAAQAQGTRVEPLNGFVLQPPGFATSVAVTP